MHRNYNILAYAALGRHQRQEGRCSWSRWAGSYSGKVCSCAWSPCCSLYRLGADEVIISRNTDQMSKHVDSFDFILDAVSAEQDINTYIQLLHHDGNITLVGAPDKRHSVSGSLIGSIAEMQEMLDFCGMPIGLLLQQILLHSFLQVSIIVFTNPSKEVPGVLVIV